MDQPEHDLRPFQATTVQSTERRAVSIGVVAAIHVVAIYAFATGLASQIVHRGEEIIKAEIVKEKPPDLPKTPPPPPPPLEKPPPPFVPPPDLNIQQEAPTNAVQNVTTVTPPPPQPVVQQPPPKAAPAPVTTPVSVGKAHECQSKYPALAMRLGHEGTVMLGMTVNTDGSVTNVHVVQSSGHDELDQGAVSCASSWHYKPSMRGDQPVAAEWKASVKYKLTGG